MGDVFNALNRANQGRDNTTQSNPASFQSAGGQEEAPGLPIDQVQAQPLSAEETAAEPAFLAHGQTTPTRGAVAMAVERAQTASDELNEQLAASPNAKVNGYSDDVVVHHDRGSLITEQYRAIRTQLIARARNRRIQTYVITSSSPGEGKSVTSINLGMAFGELKNQKTLLIEADLRRPSYERYFHRKCTPGLIQLLRNDVTEIEQAVHPTVYENLHFIPAGGHENENSTELLAGPRLPQLLERLKDRYDHIFIDTPPVVTVTDAAIIAALCNQTLLVVRLNKTPSDLVERAKRLLRASNCEIAGVVLTHLQHEMSFYRFSYNYSYNYKYSTTKKRT